MRLFPDWLRKKTTPEIRIYVLLLVVLCAGGYYIYFNLRSERIKLSRRVQNYKNLVQTYKQLKPQEQKLSQNSKQLKLQNTSPLSYLENVVPNQKLTKLSPSDQGNGSLTIDVRLEEVTARTALDLLYTIEKDEILMVKDFTLIRSTLTGDKFQLVLELQK